MMTSLRYNLSSDDGGGNLTGPGDQINTDPMIGPLQNNGGPTLTHALLPGSLAINAGDPNFTPPPFYDQRGSPFVHVFNDRIDIGSFEKQPPRRRPPNSSTSANAAMIPSFPDCPLSSGRIRRKNSLWKDSIHPGEQLRSIN